MLKTYEVKPVASGGDWAVIVLDTERGFLGIASDRGNYAFMWSHTGEDDFRSFLIGLEDSPDYLLGKLMHGRPDRQVYDGDATRATVEEHLRSLPEGQRDNELAVLADCDLTNEFGFAEWVALSMLEGAHDLVVRAPHPDCLAFCTGIYPRFVAMLRAELAEEADLDVREAFRTWSSTKGLVYAHIGPMMLLRRADPATFARLYPKVPGAVAASPPPDGHRRGEARARRGARRPMTASVTPLPCRRCSECPDALHHWLPVCDPGEEPCWGCKHCDHTCESVACEACDEEIPIDIGVYDTEDGVYLCPECLEPSE